MNVKRKPLAEALRILRDELPNIDVMISCQYSPQLADGLSKGKIDAAFLRRERGMPELAYRVLAKEPLMVVLPSDHRLVALKAIGNVLSRVDGPRGAVTRLRAKLSSVICNESSSQGRHAD